MKRKPNTDDHKKKEFDAVLKKVNKKYGKALKRLSNIEIAVDRSFKKFPRMYKNLSGS